MVVIIRKIVLERDSKEHFSIENGVLPFSG